MGNLFLYISCFFFCLYKVSISSSQQRFIFLIPQVFLYGLYKPNRNIYLQAKSTHGLTPPGLILVDPSCFITLSLDWKGKTSYNLCVAWGMRESAEETMRNPPPLYSVFFAVIIKLQMENDMGHEVLTLSKPHLT